MSQSENKNHVTIYLQKFTTKCHWFGVHFFLFLAHLNTFSENVISQLQLQASLSYVLLDLKSDMEMMAKSYC